MSTKTDKVWYSTMCGMICGVIITLAWGEGAGNMNAETFINGTLVIGVAVAIVFLALWEVMDSI